MEDQKDRAPEADRGGGDRAKYNNGASENNTSPPSRQGPADGKLSFLTVALFYGEKGIPIFPCNKLKKPLTRNGFKDATTDLEKIRAWWTQWPYAMIGMPTGRASGLFVIDIDRKNGKDGFKTLAALEAEYAPLSKTLTSQTPSGGLHLYFLMPDTDPPLRNTASKELGPGIDTRGEGGYVILPPSETDDGSYKWVDFDKVLPRGMV